MSIPLPNLDDRTYDDLVEEALSIIPSYAPQWTNHNPSDPGITLIELFAYLSEMLLYRLNRVTDANKLTFLKLIKGPDWKSIEPLNLNNEIRETILKLRSPERCVTGDDFETLVLKEFPQIARVRSITNRNLENLESKFLANIEERAGYVSVIIVPKFDTEIIKNNNIYELQSTSNLIEKVRDYLKNRQLLTTRVRVVCPQYIYIGIHLRIFLKADALEKDVRFRIKKVLQKFLHPLKGGADGKGWGFGHNIYISEIYHLVNNLQGVNYVTTLKNGRGTENTEKPIGSKQRDTRNELTIRDWQDPTQEQQPQPSNRLLINKNNDLVALKLKPEELIILTEENIELEFIKQ